MRFLLLGNVCIYKREVLDGKIRLDGNVSVFLMYLADGEGQITRGVNANLDFTEILDFPSIRANMILDEDVVIRKIECRVLNGRKVGFKVLLEVDAKVFLNINEEVVKEVTGIPDIQVQSLDLRINSLVRSKHD